jgi:hypothetical protein
LLGNLQRVVDLDPEVSDGTLTRRARLPFGADLVDGVLLASQHIQVKTDIKWQAGPAGAVENDRTRP